MYIKTICPYCGCGCQLNAEVKNNKVIKINPIKNDPVSEGSPCIKGLNSYEIIYSKDRIKTPLIRKQGKLVKATWDKAYKLIYQTFKKLKPNDLAFYGGSPASLEDNYLLQKFARDLKSDNIDSSARLCHASTCYAFNKAYGITAMPAKIDDFKNSDCILIIGSNPKSAYPVAFNKIIKAKTKGAKLICIRDWKDETSQFADLYINIDDGLQLPFLNGILNHLKEKKKLPKEIQKSLKKYTKEYTCKLCECKPKEFEKALELIQNSKKFVIGFGMGITQHIYGIKNVLGIINLCLAKKGIPISMRGKTNIQGVGDMGCQPSKNGKTIIDSIFIKPCKALYTIGSNPAQSLPDLNKAHKQLKKMFIVQQTNSLNKTSEFANVILPNCSWLERNGAFTNAESRVRSFNKAIDIIAGKPHWLIIQELANYFGLNYNYNIKSIRKEIKKKISGYKNVNFKNNFVERKITKRKYNKADFIKPETKSTKQYPLLLTTERWPFQFCSGELSRKSRTLNKLNKEALCYINPEDAKKYKLKDNIKVKITSKSGHIQVKLKINPNIPTNLVSVPFHFKEVLVNKLFQLQFNPETKEPNLKRVPVNIIRT